MPLPISDCRTGWRKRDDCRNHSEAIGNPEGRWADGLLPFSLLSFPYPRFFKADLFRTFVLKDQNRILLPPDGIGSILQLPCSHRNHSASEAAKLPALFARLLVSALFGILRYIRFDQRVTPAIQTEIQSRKKNAESHLLRRLFRYDFCFIGNSHIFLIGGKQNAHLLIDQLSQIVLGHVIDFCHIL